jgi:hypothetical protein
MKFYRDNYSWCNYNFIKIENKLTAIYYHFYSLNLYHIVFFKDGKNHNIKNASTIHNNGFEEFCLNNKYYGNDYNFTKHSWRKFVRELKLKVFI